MFFKKMQHVVHVEAKPWLVIIQFIFCMCDRSIFNVFPSQYMFLMQLQ